METTVSAQGASKNYGKFIWFSILLLLAVAEMPLNFGALKVLEFTQGVTYASVICISILFVLLAFTAGWSINAGKIFFGVVIIIGGAMLIWVISELHHEYLVRMELIHVSITSWVLLSGSIFLAGIFIGYKAK